MEQKTRLSGRVAARITSRGPALEMQEHGKSLHRILGPYRAHRLPMCPKGHLSSIAFDGFCRGFDATLSRVETVAGVVDPAMARSS
jgi:hypothetical protein